MKLVYIDTDTRIAQLLGCNQGFANSMREVRGALVLRAELPWNAGDLNYASVSDSELSTELWRN
jgi:hypothetical protein